MLPKSKHKLKAGDIASILKNRKSCDNRSSENVDPGSEVCLVRAPCPPPPLPTPLVGGHIVLIKFRIIAELSLSVFTNFHRDLFVRLKLER